MYSSIDQCDAEQEKRHPSHAKTGTLESLPQRLVIAVLMGCPAFPQPLGPPRNHPISMFSRGRETEMECSVIGRGLVGSPGLG